MPRVAARPEWLGSRSGDTSVPQRMGLQARGGLPQTFVPAGRAFPPPAPCRRGVSGQVVRAPLRDAGLCLARGASGGAADTVRQHMAPGKRAWRKGAIFRQER